MLTVGDKAPDFTLTSDKDEKISLLLDPCLIDDKNANSRMLTAEIH